MDDYNVLELLNLMYDNQEDKDDPYNIGVMGAINYIKHKAPSIGIVRCGECKKRKKNKFCLEHMRYEKDDNDFCSYGERRADEK